jgi:endoglucanase
VALAVAAAALVAGPERMKRGGKGVLGFWANRQRAQAATHEPPFAHLAVSQVGYGPAMQKRFSAPRRFNAFRVVREDGTTALEGGGPVCALPTAGLGAVETVFMGDFSALTTPGRYHLEADGLSSHAFAIGRDVYDGAVRAVQRAFYFQRAFTAVDAAHAEGPWVHPSDAQNAPPGVQGGWHDAGDFSLYSASLNTALFWLLEAYSDFLPAADDTNIPESGNGIPDLLDEARWGLSWLLSVQDAGGGFRNTTCAERYQAYGTNRPETMPPYRAGEVGTLATARAVGTLAYASTLWRRFDAAFAERMLEAARRGNLYLQQHPETSDGPTCPAYRADGDTALGRHTRLYAAAGLLLATGESQYREDFERNLVPLEGDPSYLRMGGFAAQLYLRAPAGAPSRKAALQEGLRLRAAEVRAAGDADGFQHSAPTFWGSLGAGFTRTGASSIQRCLQAPLAAARDCEQALANVHYALGRNYLQLCYLSGLPGVTHGRRHAFHHWLAALRATPFLFPGLVAGGPNASPELSDGSNPLARPVPIWGYWGDPAFPRDEKTPFEARYTDNDSWSTNEVSLDWQASALYSLYFAQWVAKNPPPSTPPTLVEAGPVDAKLPRCVPTPGPD